MESSKIKAVAVRLVAAVVAIAFIFIYGSGILGNFVRTNNSENAEVTIKASGAFALYPMMVKWGEEYHKLHPEVTVETSAGGAGKGMTDALSGMVDLGMVSRDIAPEEIAQGAYYVAVTKDAVVVTVNRNNPVLLDILAKGIDKEMFYDIFVAGNVTTWGEVVGKPSITDKINVYTRSDSCGAADTWAKYLGKKQEDLKGIGVYGDPGVVEAVRKDRLGVGYNNIGYAYDMDTKAQVDDISVVPIDINGNGKVDSSESFYATKSDIVKAINDKAYPSPPARLLNLVTKGSFTGATKDFVKWILTDGQKYVEEAGYVSLPQSVLTEQINKLSS